MILLVFMYVVAAMFVAGNAYRIARIARMSAHLRWELYPMADVTGSYFEQSEWWNKPRTNSLSSELIYMLGEVLTFTTVRKRNPPLWLWSWLMHLGLYTSVVTIAFIFTAALTRNSLIVVIQISAMIGACIGLAGVAGLLARRLQDDHLRANSSRADFFNLFLVAAVFSSGAFVHFSGSGTQDLVTFARAMLRLGSFRELGWSATAHLCIVGIFAAYFPATHMTHAYMKFFTYHRVRWDDVAIAHNPQMSSVLRANVERPITWAAPHIGAGAKSTWASVVSRRHS